MLFQSIRDPLSLSGQNMGQKVLGEEVERNEDTVVLTFPQVWEQMERSCTGAVGMPVYYS